MRYSKTRKAETRTHVVQTAARVLRRDGIDGTSLAGLMGEAGLTKGGFYAHFGSKEELVAEAVGQSLQASADRMRAAAVAAREEDRSGLAAIVDGYLSLAHAGAPETGCTIGALLSDLSRSAEPIRNAAAAGAAQLISVIEAALPEKLGSVRKTRAQAIFGMLAGSLQLMRLEHDLAARSAIRGGTQEAVSRLADTPTN